MDPQSFDWGFSYYKIKIMTYGHLTWFYINSEEDLHKVGEQIHFPYKRFRAAGDDDTNLLVWNILLAEYHPNVMIVDTREHNATPIIEIDDDGLI